MQRGFTLVELMFTIAILGVIASIAIPALNDFVARHRDKAAARQLLGSLNYARSMAVSRQQIVIVCGTSDGTSCSVSDQWTGGGLIFADTDRDGELDPGETLLQRILPPPAESTLTFNGGIWKTLRYRPDGRLNTGANFEYCPPAGEPASGWVIVLNPTGRPYFGRDGDGDGVPENGSGENLSCT
ncbi:GspH/FimT family pseudopilin [Microbulbifer magnicolonia]|uniref:GspH/FimT family pseudopilin n=1 Tax=Microbulbifer magnicolonia TaxID=3109744 RepID=UPI002B4069C4|nr:GspH/FimT family pseudopilin [Microbulbifer sp. GG15]